MKNLYKKKLRFQEVFAACIIGEKNINLKRRLQEVDNNSLKKIERNYLANAKKQELYTFEANQNDNFCIVYGKITKGEATDLYDKGLLKRKEGKKIYDKLSSCLNKCPYCGGVGFVETLDHYLPKSFYPQFSILPYNLIPACRECNSGSKGSKYPKHEEEQIIHPYFDKPIFFEEQWIYAKVERSQKKQGKTHILEYYVACPSEWNDIDKKRVKNHFDKFKIAKRYGVQASEELSIVIYTRKNFLSNLSHKDYQLYLKEQSKNESFHINHWRRVMYQALANDIVFCSTVF